jgi:hypothetical protein
VKGLKPTLSVAMVTALTIIGTSAVFAQDEAAEERANPDHPAWTTVARGSDIEGKSFQEWVNEYGSWYFWDRSMDNPPPDATADCNGGQPNEEVFFIPHTQFGNITTYDCEVRSDQKILMWLGGGIGFVEPENGETRENLMEATVSDQGHSYGFEFTVDGVTTPGGAQTIVVPEYYTVELADDNIFKIPTGPRDVFLMGSFVMIEPLPAGDHQLMVENRFFHPADGHSRARAISNLTVTDPVAAE